MKTIKMMAIAAAMTMMMSANAIASSSAPASPAEMAALTESVASADNDKYETRTLLSKFEGKMLKFDYVLDAEGTIVSKTKYANIANTNDWVPVCTFRASYGEDSNKMIYSEWNEADKAFTANPVTITFDKEECPILMRLPELINY